MNIKDLPSVKTKQNKSNHIKSIQIKPTNQITHHTTHLITFHHITKHQFNFKARFGLKIKGKCLASSYL